MSKPTNLDAQRILSILDELKEKLTYLSVVTPQVLEAVQNEEGQVCAKEVLGSELLKKIQEQIRLEELYQVSNTTNDGVFQLTDDEDQRETIEKLQKNTLDLYRRMKQKANILQELRNFQENRPQNVMQLLRTLADMQELTLKRLTTTVEEDRSRQELLDQYILREEQASKKRAQLEKDLATVRRERENSQSARTDELTRLKANLSDVKESTTLAMERLRTLFQTQMQDQQDAYNGKEESIKKEIAKVQEEAKAQQSAALEEEVQLRRRKMRGETECDKLIKDYDTEVLANVDEFNSQLIEYEKETKKLDLLQDHFRKVDLENQRIVEEDELTKTRNRRIAREEQKKHAMSAVVQAYWRGIIQREEFVKLKKAKKKGGKKAGAKGKAK